VNLINRSLVFVVLTAAASTALGAPTQFFWNNSSGGDYNNGTNWNPAGPPGSDDDAIFDITSDYAINLSVSSNVRRLDVRGGEIAFDLGGNTLTLEDSAHASAALIVDGIVGEASLWLKNGELVRYGHSYIGQSGSATLKISDGASVRQSGSPNFQIAPAGTVVLESGGRLYGDIIDSGTLTIRDGGRAESIVTIGGNAGPGQATVTGQNSYLFQANVSNGTLAVENGARVKTIRTGGDVVIDGVGTVVDSVGALGGVGGKLTVQNGALIGQLGGGLGTIAETPGSNGSVVIDGFGSIANIGSSWFRVGSHGSGSLQIQNGGSLVGFASQISIGANAGSSGSVIIDGPGSKLDAGPYFHEPVGVGGGPYEAGGAGSLTVSNGGAFVNQYAFRVWSTGSVDVQNGTFDSAATNYGLFHNDGLVTRSFVNNSGGLLTGSGVINGTLTLNSGSTVSPGNSPGTLTAGATTWNGGAIYKFEVNSALGNAGSSVGWDLLNIEGTLALAGSDSNPLRISVTSLLPANTIGNVFDFDSSNSYLWTFATASGGITGFSPSQFAIDTSGFTNPLDARHFEVRQIGNALALVFVVPEPSSFLLSIAAVVGFAAFVRRHVGRRTIEPRNREKVRTANVHSIRAEHEPRAR